MAGATKKPASSPGLVKVCGWIVIASGVVSVIQGVVVIGAAVVVMGILFVLAGYREASKRTD